MYVVMVASECAPAAKVGGLADVVFGLSRELELRGNAVEIILPKYDCMRYDQIWALQPSYENLDVPWRGGAIRCTVWFGFVHGRKCFFIDPHSTENYFNRHTYYGCDDDAMRFAFFSKAALEFMLKTNKRPEVIHTHDWQTGLVPVMLFEIYKHYGMDRQRVCHTMHNFQHQGIAGGEALWATGLHRPEYYCSSDRLGDDFRSGAINYAKGAIVFSNFVTTVSPAHAAEVRYSDQGRGLGHALYVHQGKFGGVLNGLDYEMWNPQGDWRIRRGYDAGCIEQKYDNKEALRERLWLRKDFKPLLAYVGRLDAQKGMHLVRHALFYSIWNGAQFILLGAGAQTGVNEEFSRIKHYLNDHPDCHLEIGYDEELAHLIYAGTDMLVVPSLFEPCGLTQMIAMRYGTVPIVRAVGGLTDTVFDWNYADRARWERNGYVFHQPDYPGIESALRRAIGLWYEFPGEFRELMRNGMVRDFSWREPGQHYLNIYDYIRYK